MRMVPPECMAGCQARHPAGACDSGFEGRLHSRGAAYGCCCQRDLDLDPSYKETGLIFKSVMSNPLWHHAAGGRGAADSQQVSCQWIAA